MVTSTVESAVDEHTWERARACVNGGSIDVTGSGDAGVGRDGLDESAHPRVCEHRSGAACFMVWG